MVEEEVAKNNAHQVDGQLLKMRETMGINKNYGNEIFIGKGYNGRLWRNGGVSSQIKSWVLCRNGDPFLAGEIPSTSLF